MDKSLITWRVITLSADVVLHSIKTQTFHHILILWSDQIVVRSFMLKKMLPPQILNVCLKYTSVSQSKLDTRTVFLMSQSDAFANLISLNTLRKFTLTIC